MNTQRRWLLIGAVIVGVLLAGVGGTIALRRGGDGAVAGPSPTASASPGSPSPSRSPAGPSPFTGLPGGADRPVLAIKIDNVQPARPPSGLGQADIVYVEQVEAGLSRILAVFSSRLPQTIGPVRSARESDLELLRQFGRPAFAYSGAQSKLLPLLAAARVENLAYGRVPGAYFRGSSRPAPHNLYARPERLLAAAPRASRAADIGFRFGAAPPGGSRETSRTVRYRAASFTFRWSSAGDSWLVSMDGVPSRTSGGTRLGAATVVIQYVDIRQSRFHDRGGNITPYTETVGSGEALVLRDGRAYDVRWSRPRPDGGTTFTTASGAPMTFAPGQVWVVFAAAPE